MAEALCLQWHLSAPRSAGALPLPCGGKGGLDNVCPTGAAAHQHRIQPVPAVPEDRQSQIALGHREQEHGKSVCAELLQCWGIAAAAWPGQICHTVSLQLQREIFTAARAAAEILSGSGGKNLKNAAASISRGQCSTGIFCCPSQFYSCCFGL